eukprot:8905832-Prorocentrum_lima.AAC.1
MVADPLTKGKTLRHVLNIVLHHGEWVVQHEIKKWSHRAPPTAALVVQVWPNFSAQHPDHFKHADEPMLLSETGDTESMSPSETGKNWFEPYIP